MILLGWILVPLAAALKAYSLDGTTGQYHWTWPFMKVFDNADDGIMDPGYSTYTSAFMKIVYWAALRNPVDNLKIVPYICCQIDPTKVQWVGSLIDSDGRTTFSASDEALIKQYDTKIPQWFFAWQGFYTNFYWQFNFNGGLWLFWIGWKILPSDIYGVAKYRTPRTPSGIQFNRQA